MPPLSREGEEALNPVQYIFLNRGLGMSTGKAAAQASHAAVLVAEDFYQRQRAEVSEDILPDWYGRYREWMDSGHYTKLVMMAEDSVQMHTIKHYLEARDIKTYLVIDEGRTENTAFKPTALATEIVDKDDPRTEGIFGEFKLYREKPQKESPKKGIFRK